MSCLPPKTGPRFSAEASERRCVVLHINDKYSQQKAYFKPPLFDEMAHGGHAVMLYIFFVEALMPSQFTTFHKLDAARPKLQA